ncbi:hypothetical protein I3842_Q081900 [Carya illinoinensis]|uniref:Transposase n=1 Tax=Carya illinoinensis TaxID=32201 RepID=A0A922D0A3_CARIL|nr:hypothetical protein I3842_Q081900 [Carya illinoinensis]
MPLARRGRGRSRGVCYGRGRSSCEQSVRGRARIATLNLRGDGMSTSDDSTVPPDVVQAPNCRAGVEAYFVLDWTKKNHRNTVTKTLRKRFNHIRYELHKIYKSYKTNEEALANVPELVTPATWVKLCSRWSSAEFRMISEKNKSNRAKQQTNHTTGRTSFVRLMQMRSDEHLIDFFKGNVRWSKKKGKFVTPTTEENIFERIHTKDVAASIFREVLGHRPGHARGLGEMVIPESSRQNTTEKFAALTERAERHEKDVEYYKNQLEELRGNVEKVLAKQAEYDKLLSSYMESQRQTQGESHKETQGPA